MLSDFAFHTERRTQAECKALLKAREEFKGKVELQVVAFPQDGVIREPGTEELVRQAAEMGVDVIGGIPWMEYTEELEQSHVDKMCAIAKEFDKTVFSVPTICSNSF